jgi:hypothetical protein
LTIINCSAGDDGLADDVGSVTDDPPTSATRTDERSGRDMFEFRPVPDDPAAGGAKTVAGGGGGATGLQN